MDFLMWLNTEDLYQKNIRFVIFLLNIPVLWIEDFENDRGSAPKITGYVSNKIQKTL